MYIEGTEQYKHHIEHYGSKFGYKNFIPMFKAEKFDPEEWAELFKKAGAKFAGPVAEHHDGFSMWDSKINKWNAARMGPKRDVVGELERAIRKQGMRFMVSFHHAENWWFYPHITGFDTSDPQYSGLYGPVHDLDADPEIWEWINWHRQKKPNREILQLWKEKIIEVIDKYKPDLIWFDNDLKYIQEKYKREALAYYFNEATEWNKEVAVVFKRPSLPPGVGIEDFELGRMGDLTYHNWMTDTDIALPNRFHGRWSYSHGIEYKTTTTLIHELIDIVSKNGYLLLNVGPMADGEIPLPAKKRLLEMGGWLEINGEAIYGTTPWVIYGEGPTKMDVEGAFSETKREPQYTADDIRFTVKDDALYAICLGWPGGGKEMTIRSLKILYEWEISSVSMLGIDKELQWSLTQNGLKIKTPNEKPCEHAYTFKILRG
jgi:alpha-L-fucosidase